MNGSIIETRASGEIDREVAEMRARRRRAEADGGKRRGSRAQ
jgi:hypothetical protein